MKESLRCIAIATTLYCTTHSLLAYRGTKRTVAHWLGESNYRGWYRVFYNAQALISTIGLFLYIFRQPDREIWRAKGRMKWLFHGIQFLAMCYGAWAVKEVGPARFTGLTEVAAWLKQLDANEEQTSLPLREAQGPTVDEKGVLRTGGPFRFSRHPLNFVPLVVLSMMPRVTANGLIFNALVAIYMVVGSWHEEVRLSEAYGEQFEEYRRSGVPFFIPCWGSRNTPDNENEKDGEGADVREKS